MDQKKTNLDDRKAFPQLLGRLVPNLTKAALGKRGLGEGAFLANWAEIVGDTLAQYTAPVELKFQGRERVDGTLHIRVMGAAALEVQHLLPLFLERINRHFGYAAVARIKLMQAPFTVKPQAARAYIEPALNPNAATALQAELAAIPEGPLRDALMRLGRQIMARNQGTP